MTEIWMWETTIYPNDGSAAVGAGRDLTGYDVEATDGAIGKIDEASTDVGSAHMVVDTGWWIFGKKRLIPAGVVAQVDDDQRKVWVSCTKDDIKNAPDYDSASDTFDDDYRNRVAGHYRR